MSEMNYVTLEGVIGEDSSQYIFFVNNTYITGEDDPVEVKTRIRCFYPRGIGAVPGDYVIVKGRIANRNWIPGRDFDELNGDESYILVHDIIKAKRNG